MTKAAEYLFEMPAAKPRPADTLEERMSAFADLAKSRGGLLPRSALHGVLGITKTRAQQLCDHAKLEVVHFFGQQFVTGRSLADYRENYGSTTGRGNKLTRWQAVKIGVGIGRATGSALTAE